MAYTYLIGWKHLDRWYYGMRHANKVAPEDDLWLVYKTSSVYVHRFAKKHGDPDIIRVHKEFETKDAAHLFETKFLRRVDAIHTDRWINQNVVGKPQGGTPAQLAAVKGKKQSEETIRKRGIRNPKSSETRAKMSLAHSGEKNVMFGRTGTSNPQFGRKRTPEQIERIRQGQLNRKR